MKQEKRITKPVMLRLPEDIYNWLLFKADKERRTINAQATILFEKIKAMEDETDTPFTVTQEPQP